MAINAAKRTPGQAILALTTEQRDNIRRICTAHGCGNVRVFGSFARGEAAADSDLDLLVEITGPTSQWWPGGLKEDLEELLSRRVDVVTERGLHAWLHDSVLAEAVPL